MRIFKTAQRWSVVGLVGLAALSVGAVACTSTNGDGTPTGSLATTGASTFVVPDYAEAAARAGTVLSQTGQSEGIWVNGTGRVSVTPDLAVLSLGVEAQEKTVAEARNVAAIAMQGLIDALKAEGVEDSDIQTQFFNIQPNYVWNDQERKQELDGYRVTNTVTAKVRDLSTIGDVIDGAVEAGGDETRINSVRFQAEDSSAAEAEARALAMQQAVEHAQQLADAAGVALAKPIFISESGSAPVTQTFTDDSFARLESASVAPTPIQVGELDITVTVQAVFGIS